MFAGCKIPYPKREFMADDNDDKASSGSKQQQAAAAAAVIPTTVPNRNTHSALIGTVNQQKQQIIEPVTKKMRTIGMNDNINNIMPVPNPVMQSQQHNTVMINKVVFYFFYNFFLLNF